MAKTTEERREQSGENEMGKKSVIPYGLYIAKGYVSAAQAQRVTGITDDDMELLWEAIQNMFEEDHSAARGEMTVRGLYVFKHDSVWGNAPSNVLFKKIQIKKKDDVTAPRAFSDYDVTVDEIMPDGVALKRYVG